MRLVGGNARFWESDSIYGEERRYGGGASTRDVDEVEADKEFKPEGSAGSPPPPLPVTQQEYTSEGVKQS